MSDWVRLQTGLNWGTRLYFLPGEMLDAHGTYSNRELAFTEGQQVSVRYPTGSVEDVSLVSRKSPGSYSDHGSRVDYEQTEWGFERWVEGLTFWIELTRVEVRASQMKHKR